VKTYRFAMLALLAMSGSAFAQSVNDVNLARVAPGPQLGNLPRAPQGGTCPAAGVISSAFTGATSQDGRIFRDAIASVCPNKVYPGNFGVGTQFNYETFTYPNTSGAAACVTVNFDPDTVGASPCSTNAHASAYIGSYDPANQAANFVGDVGSSLAQPFSFEVPANSDMVLVVTNTSAAAVCTFGFEVLALPCVGGGGELTPQQPVPANDRRALALLVAGFLLVGTFVIARLRN
jgi:hypothetical protein